VFVKRGFSVEQQFYFYKIYDKYDKKEGEIPTRKIRVHPCKSADPLPVTQSRANTPQVRAARATNTSKNQCNLCNQWTLFPIFITLS
jgi:hypothetical protein